MRAAIVSTEPEPILVSVDHDGCGAFEPVEHDATLTSRSGIATELLVAGNRAPGGGRPGRPASRAEQPDGSVRGAAGRADVLGRSPFAHRAQLRRGRQQRLRPRALGCRARLPRDDGPQQRAGARGFHARSWPPRLGGVHGGDRCPPCAGRVRDTARLRGVVPGALGPPQCLLPRRARSVRPEPSACLRAQRVHEPVLVGADRDLGAGRPGARAAPQHHRRLGRSSRAAGQAALGSGGGTSSSRSRYSATPRRTVASG